MSKKTKLSMQERIERDDLREVLSTPIGRRVFWRYIGEAGIFNEPGPSCNALTCQWLNGKRSFGLKVWADIHEASPEAWLLMQAEAQAQEKCDSARNERETEETRDE